MMPTREEIREELELHFKNCLDYKGMDSSIASSLSFSTVLLLADLGVVIKVDRELPKNSYTNDIEEYGYKNGYALAQYDMIETGYTVVEPLV